MHDIAITETRIETVMAVAAGCGAGALDSGCEAGPDAFRRHWNSKVDSKHPQLDWLRMPESLCTDGAPFDTVVKSSRWLATTTELVAERGRRVLVIGGDHSCAIGTWSGVSNAVQHRGSLGLIWIDAHMDMHTPAT